MTETNVFQLAQPGSFGVSVQLNRRDKQKLRVGEDIPTPDEVRRMIEAVHGRQRALLVTACFTGLRASEPRGLRWSDVELEGAEPQLHVRQRADRYRTIGSLKSASGERTVPLGPFMANTLRSLRALDRRGELIRQPSRPRGLSSNHGPTHASPGAGRRRDHGRTRRQSDAEVHGPALFATLLRVVVPQSARRWRSGIAAENCSGKVRPRDFEHDRGCLWSPIPQHRRAQRAGCRRESAWSARRLKCQKENVRAPDNFVSTCVKGPATRQAEVIALRSLLRVGLG